jgi:hypothetical protein
MITFDPDLTYLDFNLENIKLFIFVNFCLVMNRLPRAGKSLVLSCLRVYLSLIALISDYNRSLATTKTGVPLPPKPVFLTSYKSQLTKKQYFKILASDTKRRL